MTPFSIGDEVEVIANINDIFCDFMGTVIGIKGNNIIQVRDQDDDVFDVDADQCTLL